MSIQLLNNTYTNRTWVYVNVSVNDVSSDPTAFIDWNNSLVAWYRFNDETGENSTHFKDWSGHGNDANVNRYYGGLRPSLVEGKFGKALRFEAGGGPFPFYYLKVQSSPSLKIQDALTIIVWVHSEIDFYHETDVDATIIKKGSPYSDGGSYGLVIKYDGGMFHVSYLLHTEQGGWSKKFVGTLDPYTWYQLALTYDSSTGKVKLYVNDQKYGESVEGGKIITDDDPLIIGLTWSNYYSTLGIDEVRIFNRTLSEEEIKASYNSRIYKLYHNFTNLEDGRYVYKAYAQDSLVYSPEIFDLINPTSHSPIPHRKA